MNRFFISLTVFVFVVTVGAFAAGNELTKQTFNKGCAALEENNLVLIAYATPATGGAELKTMVGNHAAMQKLVKAKLVTRFLLLNQITKQEIAVTTVQASELASKCLTPWIWTEIGKAANLTTALVKTGVLGK